MSIAAAHRMLFGVLLPVLIGVPVFVAAAPPLLITFENQSGHSDSDVYIGFVGGAASELIATNVANRDALKTSRYGDPHWYRLSDLRSGISLTRLTAGRIYVSYGDPWTFLRDGYEPAVTVASDPNYHKRFDKMEMTYTGSPADVADTTSIDYFSIPLRLDVYQGGLSGKLVGSVTGSSMATTVAALGKVTAEPNAAVVGDPKIVDPRADNAFARVIGPGVYPPPPGRPTSPYDDFATYLTYLGNIYAPKHGNKVATIAGEFAGVGESPTSPQTERQAYDFTATMNASSDILLTGSGALIGKHTLLLTRADLIAPTGIYGANPQFSLDQGPPISPANDIYGWIIGDLLAGLNVGAVGSTVTPPGMTTIVGEMKSQEWFKLKDYFAILQTTGKGNYNQWAAALSPLSQAYNFAYSDRFAHVVATLNPNPPSSVDTLKIVFLPK